MLAYSFYEADNRVIRYAETLAACGNCVDVISLRQPRQKSAETINQVNIFRIQERARDEKSAWAHLARTLAFFVKAMIWLTRRHWKNRYDFVHVHSMPDFLVFAAWFPRITGSALLLDIHDLLPEFHQAKFGARKGSWISRALLLEEWLCAHFAHHVIIANHLWFDVITQRSVPQARCTVLMNSPDRSLFSRVSHRRADDHNHKFVLLYPGSLNHHQGLDLAIQAIHELRHNLPHLELRICGSGPARESLRELARSLHLEGQVVFLEPRAIWEIPRLMQDADAGIVPKRGDSFGNEAFSTKVLEFMAMGVPVIVADTRVDRFYFNTSVVRFFLSGNAESLAESIKTLAEDPPLCKYLARNALDFVKRNDWDTNKHTYLALVDRLTQSESPALAASANTL
ncbi:MAG: glycosyltransferase [Acidobacteriaceae bacterium]